MEKDLKAILSPIEGYLARVDTSIENKLKTGIPVLDQSAMHLFRGAGKKIRASVVILSSGLENDVPDGTVDLAAAAEIVHAATLIHDDIIDQSLLRRGDITVSRKFGNKIAVLAGDYMYTTALNVAMEDGNPEIFPVMVRGTRDLVKGELLQLQYSNPDNITEDNYFKIIELKTARFMASCAEVGAVKSEYGSDLRNKLYDFGLNLGYAFQIVDDTLDIIDSENLTGKDIGNDFKDGKVTLPFIRLFETSTSKERNDLVVKMENQDEESWAHVRQMLLDSGSLDSTLKTAGEFIDKSLRIIESFNETEFRNIFREIALFIINRKY